MAAPFSKDIVNSIRIADPGRRKQILLKVRFAQVDRTKLSQFGINLFSTGAGNTFGATGTGQFGGVSGSNVGAIPAGVKSGTTPNGNNLVSGGTGNLLFPNAASFGMSELLNVFLFRSDLNLGATIKALQ